MRLIPNPTFSADVKFTAPGGGFDLLRITFKHKSPEALAAWLVQKETNAIDAVADIVDGWEEGTVVDAAGNAVLFSRESLTLFLNAHGPRLQDLIFQYLRELTESRIKN